MGMWRGKLGVEYGCVILKPESYVLPKDKKMNIKEINAEIFRLQRLKHETEQKIWQNEREAEEKELKELKKKIKSLDKTIKRLDEKGAKAILNKSEAEVAELREAREAANDRYEELMLPKCDRCGYRGEDAWQCICYAR